MNRDNKGNKVDDRPYKKKKRPGSKRKTKRDLILVIDLEATCWDHPTPEGMEMEIIEIGISAVDYKTKEIRLKETILIKPEYSEVSEFCNNLTTHTQENLEKNGVSFAEACQILEDRFKSKKRIWMSWGEYDKNQFEKDCEKKGVKYPFGRTHINMKPLFSFAYGITNDLGVGQALEHLGLEFEGTPHRGDDDAYNIARILQKVFIPLIGGERYGDRVKKEHEILEAHLNDKYNEEELNWNAARIINKTTPQNPDKSNR